MKTSLLRFMTINRTVILLTFFLLFCVSVMPSFAQIMPAQRSSNILRGTTDGKNVTGNLEIAIAWGEQLSPPHGLTRGIINLKEAMNKWTKVTTSVRSNLMLSDQRMLAMPFTGGYRGVMFSLPL